MRWQNALSFFCQSVLQTSEIVYGSKLKIYVGNWTEEQFVISTLCFLTIISNYLPSPVIWRVINQLPASTKPYEFSLSWRYFFCCSWYLLTMWWNYFWRNISMQKNEVFHNGSYYTKSMCSHVIFVIYLKF